LHQELSRCRAANHSPVAMKRERHRHIVSENVSLPLVVVRIDCRVGDLHRAKSRERRSIRFVVGLDGCPVFPVDATTDPTSNSYNVWIAKEKVTGCLPGIRCAAQQ
jgi:hypothetical protein